MKNLTRVLILAALGGAVVWLFASEEGCKILDNIKDKTDDLASRLKSGLNTVKDTTDDLVKTGKSYIDNVNDAVQEAI